MPHDVRAFLSDIVEACALISVFIQGVSLQRYREDALLRSAVERQLMIIGEALRQALNMAPEYEARITDAPTIIAFRNRLVHGYMAIEHDTVWGVT
ncbi:MAG: DUF86 domain-containing protein [Armatimonadetes bacterium]|nr:DUF86 domain-containing protein [Armatimonadota bacterium]